ncbi:cytochrome P450 [Mycena albidolilacea]|uniref:Cytochrome P450 n=1 Tax=Mycena albidolilacea TaxID=1033008 RepID=A0AAD7EZW1_9AGAR|nr:cytochrome P450 [Mycena albidolilacea]
MSFNSTMFSIPATGQSNSAIIVGVLVLFSALLVSNARKRPLPPGPFSIPFVGSPFSVPKSRYHIHYAKWFNKYGPISYFGIFGRSFVVLNDEEAINELFERRSKIYCSRPRMTMAGDLVGRDKSMLFLPYGDRFKETQRLLHIFLKQSALSQHYSLQEKAMHGLLSKLLSSPENFERHVRSSVSSAIVRLVYGHQILDHTDMFVTLAESLGTLTDEAAEPGRWLVDSFPVLRFIPAWFPGASFQRWAALAREQCRKFTRLPYEEVKTSMNAGTCLPCFTRDLLNDSTDSSLTEEQEDLFMYASASLYIGMSIPVDIPNKSVHESTGGTNTVISPVLLFILMMCRHPEIQRNAQHEVDALTSEDNIPRMEDALKLPFIKCIMQELFRFAPPAPLLVHSPIEDDIYQGFLIPKGSMVMANVWGMSRNYPDPDSFNPDRFAGTSPQRDPSEYIFGLGRRACPGDEFTRTTLLLAFAQILWAFDISEAVDSAGNSVKPEVVYVGGYILQPAPFKCTITPRNSIKAAAIRATDDAAE